MEIMFFQTTKFNQSLNNWNTSKVSTMSNMFADAISFNSSINTWNVSSVTDMNSMFNNASSFNQDLSNWSTLKVSSMVFMFQGASSFNQDISMWNVSTVSTANYIFCGCPVFGQTAKYPNILPAPIWGCSNDSMIINAYIPSVVDFSTVILPFSSIVSLDVDWGDGNTVNYTSPPVEHTYITIGNPTITISGTARSYGYTDYLSPPQYAISSVSRWGNLGISSLAGAFSKALNLVSTPNNIPSSVIDMTGMFFNAINFNSSISGWDVSRVTNMAGMFSATFLFNQNISGWNTSKVTNMTSMFAYTSSFNQDISTWNVSRVTDMSSMFNNAFAFNQDISGWNVSNVTKANFIFCDCPQMIANAGFRPPITITYTSSCS
jgi:surface protein